MSEIEFRGVKNRTFADQTRALEAGYSSVAELAIDELGHMVLDLARRVEKLEAIIGAPVMSFPPDSTNTNGDLE